VGRFCYRYEASCYCQCSTPGLDCGLLPHNHFGVGGRRRPRKRAGAASCGANSATLGWRRAWIPTFARYRMARAAIVFILAGIDGAHMAGSTRHYPCLDRALLTPSNRNDDGRRNRISGWNCNVLALQVLSLVNECRGPVRHSRCVSMDMLSCRLLVCNCASLTCYQEGLTTWPHHKMKIDVVSPQAVEYVAQVHFDKVSHTHAQQRPSIVVDHPWSDLALSFTNRPVHHFAPLFPAADGHGNARSKCPPRILFRQLRLGINAASEVVNRN
jgi:hypothetical protein